MGLRQTITSFAIVMLALIHTPIAFAENDNHTTETCEQKTQIVTLSELDDTPYELTGWLCYRGNLHDKTVLLTIPGLTYDHHYWQWPQETKTYSFVREVTKKGYATFSIDRLGTGLSDHPADPDSLTTQSQGYVTHQVVQQLRSGAMGTAFHKVVLIGHSFGSQVLKYEVATYNDVDAAIITGSLHQTSPQVFTIVAPTFYPAVFDPKFASSGLALGYLTTMPGTRSTDFYNPTIADPAVIAKDEALKETATSGEFATITDAENLTLQIHVPILLVMGENDILFCDETLSCSDSTAILNRENSFYSQETCLEAYVLPYAGHSINLHTNAKNWYKKATNWLDRHVGTKKHEPTNPCTQ